MTLGEAFLDPIPCRPNGRPGAFAGEKPSGFVPHVHLFTAENVDKDGGAENKFDPGNGYRDEYKKIWGVK